MSEWKRFDVDNPPDAVGQYWMCKRLVSPIGPCYHGTVGELMGADRGNWICTNKAQTSVEGSYYMPYYTPEPPVFDDA